MYEQKSKLAKRFLTTNAENVLIFFWEPKIYIDGGWDMLHAGHVRCIFGQTVFCFLLKNVLHTKVNFSLLKNHAETVFENMFFYKESLNTLLTEQIFEKQFTNTNV